MKKQLLTPVLFIFPLILFGQNILTGISSKWDDSFIEWRIFTDEEDYEGELKMRWIQQNDFSKWNYDLNDEYGRIETKWRDDFSEWQVFGEEEIVSIRPRWPRDFSQWRITDNDKVIHLKTRFSNRADEWIIDTEKHGWFTIYTEYRNDPRDWIIIDELNEDISQTMKMAMVFVAIFNASPKE